MAKLNLTNGQLEPKDGKRWLEMVGFHKQIPKDWLPIPAEQWYYFYIAGIMMGYNEVYNEAKRLGRREIPDCATDWTDLMRWLERHLSTLPKAKEHNRD